MAFMGMDCDSKNANHVGFSSLCPKRNRDSII